MTETNPAAGWARLSIGLAQGASLYLLSLATESTRGGSPLALLLATLLPVALFLPPVAILSLGRLRPRHLALWLGGLTLVLAGLGAHGQWRRGTVPDRALELLFDSAGLMSEWLFLGAAAAVFVANALVLAAAQDGRPLARYGTYYDVAWKQGVQLVFAGNFTGALWLVLFLGAALFDMLHIDFFSRLIAKPWFYWPVTFTALATAIHLTDVAPAIIAGIRRLALLLLSWLLPLLVVIAIGFLATLAATSLDLLWQTRMGAATLLSAAAVLVVLANAAYQQGPPRDGEDGHLPARPLAWAGSAVGPLLLALVGLAGHATALRVGQYGWTADRVLLAACVAVAAVYAVGYTAAGWWNGQPRRRWEATNVAAAFVSVLLLLALLSPVADPARVAVASQVERLFSGRVDAAAFDFAALRFDGQRYGREALDHLAASGDAQVADKARAALDAQNRWRLERQQARPVDVAANLVTHPTGQPLPAGITALNLDYLDCFRHADRRCDVVLLGEDRDGRRLALILERQMARPIAHVLVEQGNGVWRAEGNYGPLCPAQRDALLRGAFALEPSALPDLRVGDRRMVVADRPRSATAPCD